MRSLLVDSHCHLPLLDNADEAGIAAVLGAAREQGVGHMLCVSVDLQGVPDIIALARRHPNVSASVGLHPNSSIEAEPSAEALSALAGDDSVVAIGETGLDYYRSSGDLEWQRRRFREHIAAARLCRKPLIIHMRQASADTIRILREEHAEEVGGVMHCFTEDWETASDALDLGFYISFSGIVTFKSAQALQAVAARVPLERLLVETDAPYLAPVPYRGQPNQPAYVRYVAEHVARLRDMELDELARATTDNFFRLFSAARPAALSAIP